MKTIQIKFADVLMVFAAIGNNNWAILNPVLQPIREYVQNNQVTNETLIDVTVTIEQLNWIYGELKTKEENQYASTNKNLLAALMVLAQNGDAEIYQFLVDKGAERDSAITDKQNQALANFFTF